MTLNCLFVSKFMKSMAALVGSGGPVTLLAYITMVIYIKLMKGISTRPVIEGKDVNMEKVISYFFLEGKQYSSLLDETQEDQLNDCGGDNDPDHHHDCVRDLIHLDIHFPLPLTPHDQTHEAQHQLSGSDLHWAGGDGRDHSETGEDQITRHNDTESKLFRLYQSTEHLIWA